RFERLVAHPEEVLRELCEYVDLPFDLAMLRAHERAADRLAQLPESRRSGGQLVTRDERIARHVYLQQPPDPTRIGRWRQALSAEDVARFEDVAGELLVELGYPPSG